MSRIVFNNRACGILYNYLKSNCTSSDKWILPANICPVVCLTFLTAGISFELADINEMQTLDEPYVLSVLSKGSYKGVLFNNAYGYQFSKHDFFRSIKLISPDIQIIDDRSLCVPQPYDDLGINIDLRLYSTGYSKFIDLNYGAFGFVANHRKYEEHCLEYNSIEHKKLDYKIKKCQINKCLLDFSGEHWLDNSVIVYPEKYLEQISSLIEKTIEHKTRINEIYRQFLPKELQWGDGWHNWRFMISTEHSDEILKALFDAGLFASQHYPSTAVIFHGVKRLNAEKYHSTILNLFNDFRVDANFALVSCEIINKVIAH